MKKPGRVGLGPGGGRHRHHHQSLLMTPFVTVIVICRHHHFFHNFSIILTFKMSFKHMIGLKMMKNDIRGPNDDDDEDPHH